MFKKKILNKFSKYKFEIRHITIFFTILIMFQIALAFIQKSSLDEFMGETQAWYRKYSAEKLAVVTSTSMELLFENLFLHKLNTETENSEIIYSFNVIFKQQLLQKSVEDIFLVLSKDNKLYVIDSGQKFYPVIYFQITAQCFKFIT